MLLVTFIIVNALSLFVCAFILYEFIHIHTKRVRLLDTIEHQDVRIITRGRKRSVGIYSLSTIAIIVFSSIQLFA